MATDTASAATSVVKKKTASVKKPRPGSLHPPFLELPLNFQKILLVRVKKFVASRKLVKVKTSYKLPLASVVVKKPANAKPKATSAAIKPKPMVVKAPVKSKAKSKVATPVKAKAKAAVKPKPKVKAVTKPTSVTKMVKTSSTGKKVKEIGGGEKAEECCDLSFDLKHLVVSFTRLSKSKLLLVTWYGEWRVENRRWLFGAWAKRIAGIATRYYHNWPGNYGRDPPLLV
ncbi:hypothetical protein CXB51_028808 [Gossypium anomalum]|uniref:Uncharacterized protein n=1 Tax=Gossypium anomalum TaxID=47600 RepID=A0A8J6CT72_9ROSI|nr:hypothetical protein CXB51_028808 [Gossypium anomalum]